jgi:hypothetical protein
MPNGAKKKANEAFPNAARKFPSKFSGMKASLPCV